MKTQLKQAVFTDLSGALTLVGIARKRIGDTSTAAANSDGLHEWEELGKLYDAIDALLEMVAKD